MPKEVAPKDMKHCVFLGNYVFLKDVCLNALKIDVWEWTGSMTDGEVTEQEGKLKNIALGWKSRGCSVSGHCSSVVCLCQNNCSTF